MIWVNERREVGVWTTVIDRAILNMEEEFGRELRLDRSVPMYTRQIEGSVKYTLGFEYLAIKTGFVGVWMWLMVGFCWQSWRRWIGLIGIRWLLFGEGRIRGNFDSRGSSLLMYIFRALGQFSAWWNECTGMRVRTRLIQG